MNYDMLDVCFGALEVGGYLTDLSRLKMEILEISCHSGLRNV